MVSPIFTETEIMKNEIITANDTATTSAADPFQETYKSAWLSTCHLAPETLNYLNALPADMLPFWVHATLYGWIVRFDALDTIGLAEEGEEESRELAGCADLMAIKAALFKHGYQAAHLDADGPVIDGLTAYDH